MRQLSYLTCLLIFTALSPACGGSEGNVGGDNTSASGSTGTGSAPACPDISGEYDIMSAVGECNTLNVDASQSIRPGKAACFVEFVSDKPEPGAKAVSGGATLDEAGKFSDARLFLDDVLRFPCTGSWDAKEETMTIVCEGVPGNCTVVLKRL